MDKLDTHPRIIKPRDREAIIRSLRSGVVPAIGLHHIQVGRGREIASFLRDIDTVADGGASFRIVVGEYGSGKTFFLSLARTLALERGLVAMRADLSPEKRFNGSHGQPRRLLQELVASLSTRTKQDGAALPVLLQRLKDRGMPLEALMQLPSGPEFAKVVRIAAEDTDEERRASAMRWLSADIANKSDARRLLGVAETIADADLLTPLRLYAALAVAAGFSGLYVCIDEMVNLFKIVNTVSRRANYESLLAMLNGVLQGSVHSLGIVLGGTPEFLTDTRRGLYSYEALRSRLAENSLAARAGMADYDSTVLRLPNLTREELYVLLRNLRRVFASGRPGLEARVPDEVLEAYLHHCFEKIGESYFRTPRNTIKGFIDLLSLLDQYPEATWRELLPGIEVAPDRDPSPMSTFEL